MAKVYIVLEDADEFTTELVTTSAEKAHAKAKELVEALQERYAPPDGLEVATYGTTTIYDLGDYYVRVEEHEVEG